LTYRPKRSNMSAESRGETLGKTRAYVLTMRTLCLRRSIDHNRSFSKRLILREARSASRYRTCWISWSAERSFMRTGRGCRNNLAPSLPVPAGILPLVETTCRHDAGLPGAKSGKFTVRAVAEIITPTGKPPPLAVRLAKALPFQRAQVEMRDALAAHDDLHTADGAHARSPCSPVIGPGTETL
jgi:hypothetical protein